MLGKIMSRISGKSAKTADNSEVILDPNSGLGAKLRQVMLFISDKGGESALARDVRTLTVGAAKLARSPGKLAEMIEGMSRLEALQAEEGASHINAQAIAEGKAGRFDVCDLENWMAIVAKANVPAVEARVIERFSAEEINLLSGPLDIGGHKRIDRAKNTIRKGLERDLGSIEQSDSAEGDVIDMEKLIDRVESAMDDIPEGWMVRTHVCGGDNLKALAGCGVVGPDVPDVRFGPDLEVGPGWIRRGNRRALNITDHRTTSLYVQNDTKPLTVMARPWKTATRYYQGRDPHRAGTPLDVPGLWPAEWRAFVVDGVVTGIANYYGWVGETNAESARQALKVRELAQRIVDTAIAQNLEPRSMSVVLGSQNPAVVQLLEANKGELGRFSATLDFIETNEGILFLEGGPASNQIAGGHPCAFAGDHRLVETPSGDKVRVLNLEGVAFKTMPGIMMAEPKTWAPADKTGCILNWDEVEALAGVN